MYVRWGMDQNPRTIRLRIVATGRDVLKEIKKQGETDDGCLPLELISYFFFKVFSLILFSELFFLSTVTRGCQPVQAEGAGEVLWSERTSRKEQGRSVKHG